MVEYIEMPGVSNEMFLAAINWAKINSQGGKISLYTDEPIEAGGTFEPLAIELTSYHSGYLFIKNTGPSTNLVVEINSSDDAAGTIKPL